MSVNTRLRIATRIHFALLRYLGEGIDVAAMLKRPNEAREVLWVCQGSGDAELMALARQYDRAVALEQAPDGQSFAAGHAPQDTTWSTDTSGFGLSQPPAVVESPKAPGAPRPGPSKGWFASIGWPRRQQQSH